MEYRRIKIKLEEAQSFQEVGYTVSNSSGLVFKASWNEGKAYANDPESALDLVKSQIYAVTPD